MSECTTDRRPTKADADKNDQVLAWVLDNGYKDHPRWVFRHYTNVEVGQPWLPTPEPYVPPIDTSLAASIERYENLGPLTATYNECKDDRTRIIEAAKKWSAKQATKEFANQPLPLDLDAPDPGEGWELCSAREAEQNWNDVAGKWMHGKDYGGFNRRRVVMTEPPQHDQGVVAITSKGSVVFCSAGGVRKFWKHSDKLGSYYVAWCHRLDGETEPPQFALEWANNR
jgi:hypothetical protein